VSRGSARVRSATPGRVIFARVSFHAVVLLGCRVGRNGALPGAARRRAARAAEAWHRGCAPVILVSGGRRWHGVSEADALRQQLVADGVPEEALVLERRSCSTRENARYAVDLLRARSATHIGVVSCDWHLPRAVWAFRRHGLSAFGLPAVSPPVGRLQRWYRHGRERLSWVLDRVAVSGTCSR